MSTQSKANKSHEAKGAHSTLESNKPTEPKEVTLDAVPSPEAGPGVVDSTTDLGIVKGVPSPMPGGEAARPDATWTADQWLAWAEGKWKGARMLERKTGPEYWDSGYGIGQAHRKWEAEKRTGWVQEVTKRFGAYATARQLERIAETIKREDSEGFNITQLKQKCGIVSIKEDYNPTAWKDEWAATWERPSPTPATKEEDRWEEAVQDAQNHSAVSSTPGPVSAAPVASPAKPAKQKAALSPPSSKSASPIDWQANLEKLGVVETSLREVLTDFKAAPPKAKMKETIECQFEEAMLVADELRKVINQ